MNVEVELIKERIDIVEYIGRSVQLKKSGRNFQGLCPFHNEKSPSFNVSADRQIFKCFGCGVTGDLFTFVMQRDGFTFNEALKMLAEEAGVELKQDNSKLKEQRSMEERLYEMHLVAAEYYHYLLMKHEVAEEAREYLEKRGFKLSGTDDTKKTNIVNEFKIGYSPKSWDSLSNFLYKKGFSYEEMLKGGLVVKSDKKQNSYYDMFRGRVMFPLYDKSGRVVGFAGRVLGDSKTAKYINTSETVIFHKREFLFGFYQAKESIRKSGEAILVEGEMDMLSSYQAGVTNVAAVKGSALTVEQIEMLSKLCTRLLLCFDNDSAGDKAKRQAIELAETKGIEIKVIQVKAGKDPDECIRKDVSLWVESIQHAVPIYDYVLNSALKKYSVGDAIGKRNILTESLPLLLQIKDIIIRGHYLQKLSTYVDIPEQELLRLGRSLLVKAPINQKVMQTVSPRPPVQTLAAKRAQESINVQNRKLLLMERYFLAILIRLDTTVEGIERKLPIEAIDDKNLKIVYTAYVQFFAANPEKRVSDFLENYITDEMLPIVDDLFLVELDSEDETELRSELFLSIKNLREYHIREEIRVLSLELKKLEMQGNKEELEPLQVRLGELLVKLGKVQKLV
jgi:DNA primase